MSTNSCAKRLLAAIVLWGLWAASTWAQSPIPQFNGERLYVSGVPDRYAPVREELERIQPDSRQDYYVVIVATSGSGEWATRDYIDRLYDQWTATARQRGLKLDPLRHVIIVLAETNRQISIHCGSELQSHYGLLGSANNDELVDPFFLPHARAGNYTEGLTALLRGTEQWIRRRDAAETERKAAAQRRAEEIRRNAEAAVSGADALMVLAQQELDASRKLGFQVDALAKQLENDKPRVTELKTALDESPSSALDHANQLRQRLQSAVDQLRQLPALAAQSEQMFGHLSARSAEWSSSVDRAQRSGLPVAAIETRIAAFRDKLSALPDRWKSDPAAARQEAESLQSQAKAITIDLAELPALHAKYQQTRKAAAESRKALAAEIRRVTPAGIDVADAKRQLAEIDKELSGQESLVLADPAAALRAAQASDARGRSALADLTKRHDSHVAEVRRQQAQYRFLTRTLPMSLASALAVLVLASLALRMWWVQRRRRATADALDQFRAYTTGLLDRMESLKKRHQLLPFNDPDYSEPLSGETLVFYNGFDQLHNELRQHWLQLMERRQEIEVLVQSSRFLRTGSLRDADERLAKWDKQTAEQAYSRCEGHLQQLELAHEQAREKQQALTSLLQQAQQRIASIRSLELATKDYETGCASIEQASVEMNKTLQADPIGVSQRVEELQKHATELDAHCANVLQQAERCAQLAEQLQQAERQANEAREAGLLFREKDSDPDPPTEESRTCQAAAWKALDGGDWDTARKQIDQGTPLLTEAIGRIRTQFEAKEFCAQDGPKRQDVMEQLRQLLQRGRNERKELESRFAPESWSDVAEDVDNAAGLLDDADSQLQQAQSAAGADVQHYFAARRQLEQVAQQQEQIRAQLEEVHLRLQQLIDAREQCGQQQAVMAERADEAQRWMERNDHVIGGEARELMAAANRFREQAETAVANSRPHWLHARKLVEEATNHYVAALQQASQDVRCHEDFVNRLGGIQQESQRVAQLLRSNTADRPRANQRLQSAAAELILLSQPDQPRTRDWQGLLRRLEQVAAGLQKAEEWAREDIRISQQAAAELKEAERAIETATSFYGQGISADVSRAQSLLDDARRQFLSQSYEQAIQLADQAEASARQAAEDAQRRAEQRRQAREWEQRRRVAATIASAAFSTRRGSSFSFGSSGTSRSSSSRSSSSSSSRSWSSGSSQRSW